MALINPGDWPIDPNVVDGTELAARLNRLEQAIVSGNASATRPPYLTAGSIWAQTGTGSDLTLNFFDGTADHPVGSVIGGVVKFGGATFNSGATAAKPTAPVKGDLFFDTTLNLLEVYDGGAWKTPEARSQGQNISPYGNRNIIINGDLKINQRGLSVASVAIGQYGEDRWKKTAGGMTQIIEDVNYEPSTIYTLSGNGITTAQLTSPASGNWTLPDIPVTARKIQLEKGTVATSFEYRQYQQELALCQSS